MFDSSQPTETGGLQPHLAAAACYVPLMYVHLIASSVFLFKEPRDHTAVRFHAAQSLLISACWLGGSMLLLLLMFVTPFAFMFLGVLLTSVSEDVGVMTMFIGILGQIVFGALAILAALAGPVVLLGMSLLSALEKDVRIPGLSGLATRIAGQPG